MDSTSFSQALKVWSDINLSELQKTLDQQGIEIVDNQKDNMLGRKKLAEQTREFKKIPAEEQGPAFKTLLKAYQGEIDALTRRSKSAENSFLSVYKLLAEAPDPFPLLDAAVDQTARASEARILESELAREKEEVNQLKQQLLEAQSLEKERKRLAEKVEKLENRMDDLIQENVSAKEAELHATYDERLRNYDEREKDLQRQVSVARSQLRDLRTTADSSQAKLFDHSQRQDLETISRLAEADLMTEDLERANNRVAEVERRNETLRAEIESVRSGSETQLRVETLESQVSDLQTEASRLIRQLEQQKEINEKEKIEHTKQVSALNKQIATKEAELGQLKERIKQFSDYDELKREVEIMKFVEFAGIDFDEDEDDAPNAADDATADLVRMPNPNADKANQQRGKPLENLLMTKNKKLQDELTKFRVLYQELFADHENLSRDVDELNSRFEEQRNLNDRLENDLLRINQNGAQNNSTPSNTAANREDPLASLNLGRKEIPVAGSAPNAPPAFTSSAETSILPIITSQRDRFRQRNAELEEELRRQFETVSDLRTEIKKLQTDNMKLYEKVRYLQSYRDEAAGTATAGGSIQRGGAFQHTITLGDAELGKYQKGYEDSVNPFEAFRGRERGRAIHMLNPLEKILLSISTLVLSNRYSRNLFVVYAVGLHFALLSILYSGFRTSSETHLNPVAVPPI